MTKVSFAGDADMSDILTTLDVQIENEKEEAISRKKILDKVDKLKHAKEEEKWLDDYEKVNYPHTVIKFFFMKIGEGLENI